MAKTEIYQMQEHVPACLNCSAKLTAHAGPCMPSTGDVSICAHCGTPSFFEVGEGGEIRLRPPVGKDE